MRPLEGVPVYRRLRDRLDPAVVFQVDIFWVVVGGADPATVIDELGDRVVSLHIKDGVTLPTRRRRRAVRERARSARASSTSRAAVAARPARRASSG